MEGVSLVKSHETIGGSMKHSKSQRPRLTATHRKFWREPLVLALRTEPAKPSHGIRNVLKASCTVHGWVEMRMMYCGWLRKCWV